jgi:DNA-binding transcriptional MerR regulator
MVANQEINLSLEELAGEVALTLEHYQLLGSAHDSRVSPVPDARTIRYYTTLGLLDRPWMEGRQARYGRRHLLQLLTIKALQGRGMPLSEVQQRMYGLSDAELESLLTALAEAPRAISPQPVQVRAWKEVIIEPGLKLMAEEGWFSKASQEDIEEKIRAAIAALSAPDWSNGGLQ